MEEAVSALQGLQEEATCSICLEYYTDPVTTQCGHNFCRACITLCPGAGAALPCPQCRELCPQWHLRVNRQLQSIVQLVRRLPVPQPPPMPQRPPAEGGLCGEHEERLKLFCEEDQKLICVICRESRDHKEHSVSPVREAAQVYARELQHWLQPLREEREGVLQRKLKEEEDCGAMRNKLKAERMKIETEFERLHQTLKEREQTLLRRLEEMHEKITLVENTKIATLSEEISSLEELISEIASKCKQPAEELLKDVRCTLKRCEHTKALAPEAIRKKYKVHLTLDADTASRYLTLSENGKRVKSRNEEQRVPYNRKRFTQWCSVLGTKGFSSGRHYWELQLLRNERWVVGVIRDSVSRLEHFTHSPERGIWALNWSDGQCNIHSDSPSSLNACHRPVRLGVYLDYEGERLSVFNADTMDALCTFTGAAFDGRVNPYFCLWRGTDLRLV